MSDLANLPSDITTEDFFRMLEEALADEPMPQGASAEKAAIRLVGDGEWSMGFEDGKIAFKKEEVAEPPVRITLTVDDWRAFLAGRVRDAVSEHVDTKALDPKGLAKLYRSAEKVDQIKALKGDVKFTVRDEDHGAQYSVTITTGGGEPNVDAPTTAAAVTLANFIDLATGKENPQTAFFTGKIELDGDLNFVMGFYGIMAS